MDKDMSDLLAICKREGVRLDGLITHNGHAVPGALLLWCIAGNESSFGRMRLFAKHEPAYMPAGRYYKGSEVCRALWRRYGVLASCSFGAFQILFITATEVGFSGHPCDLQDSATSARYVVDLILRRFVQHQGANSLIGVLDAYNTGDCRDRNVPEDYVNRALATYRGGLPTGE